MDSTSSPEQIDIISTDIDYFTELFFLIDNIQTLTPFTELKHQITEFIPKMTSKSSLIKKESSNYIKRALSECIYKKSSSLFRYLLSTIYKVKYPIQNDMLIQTCCFDDYEDNNLITPYNIFADNQTISKDIDVVFKEDKTIYTDIEMKTLGSYFDLYESKYEWNKTLVKELFMDITMKNNAFTKLDSLLLSFPEYSELFNKSYKDIIYNNNNNNNISMNEVYYLGIIANASIGCEFLNKDLIRNFLISEGHKEWIRLGLEGAPKRFKQLSKVANILAHQPWTLKVSDIIEGGIEKNKHSFIRDCIIITYYQRLASIIQSLKINFKEPEMFIGSDINNISVSSSDSNVSTNTPRHNCKVKERSCVETIIQELKKGDNSRERKERQEQMKMLTTLIEKSEPNELQLTNINSNKFREGNCLTYVNFQEQKYKFVFSVEFSFETIATCVLSEYCPEEIKNLRKEYDYLYEMTSHHLGKHKVEYSLEYYRWAIVTYVEKLFGLWDEAFDYSKTNRLMSKAIKTNIKNATCFPESVDFSMLSNDDFSWQDLLHIVLLATVSKQRAQLTYLAKMVNELQLSKMK